MPDTTHFVPKEPGYYFAKLSHDSSGEKCIVEVSRLNGRLIGRVPGFECHFEISRDLSDFSPRITEPPAAPVTKEGEALYYLRSIMRQLQGIARSPTPTRGVADEALSDNIDWLDCYIDELERLRAAVKGGR